MDAPATHDIRDEMHELVAASLRGDITPAQRTYLDELVSRDVETCDLYLDLIFESSILLTWAKNNRWEGEGFAEINAPIYPGSLRPSSSASDWLLSYVVAGLLLAVMLTASWMLKTSRVADMAQNQPSPIRQNVPAEQQFEFVGRITGMKDCRWSDPGTASLLGASVALNREYALTAGLLEITYQSGARVILEGPCTYRVESDSGGYLAVGKLTARVEIKGSGFRGQGSEHSPLLSPLFAVRTPTAIVTDLGTEFGVEVDDNGDTTSYVFQGSISVQGLVASATSSATQNETILHENESIRVSRVRETHQEQTSSKTVRFTHPTNLPEFIRKMPHLGSMTEIDYAELVRSFNPVVYYRMERPADENTPLLVADSSVGGHHGDLHSQYDFGEPYRPGRWGDATHFRGPRFVDHVLVSDYPKAVENKLTVTAWVTAEKWMIRWPKIVSNWGNTKLGQFNIGLYDRDNDLTVRLTQRNGVRVTLRENAEFPFGQWQHVAFVADGKQVILFRNGMEVARAECDGVLAESPIPSLAIGGKTDDSGQDVIPDFCWYGLIDEVAVFNEALKPEEINRLYEAKPLSAEDTSERR